MKRVQVPHLLRYKLLFNSDALSKIITYLPSVDVLSLAVTSKRFGISNNDELSLIKKSAHIMVHEIATKEQLVALPHYDGESSLADYHYLQLMRESLSFDQLTVGAEYVNSEDKSCVRHSCQDYDWHTAFSNNILRAGKHYASFILKIPTISSSSYPYLFIGLMRPGQANQGASYTPLYSNFYRNFSRYIGHGELKEQNNNIQCCMYITKSGNCHTSDWNSSRSDVNTWEGIEGISSDGEIGMLLDLDEGTLSVYKNGRKLGVMKSGLVGSYCWFASMHRGSQVTIKRGTIPPN